MKTNVIELKREDLEELLKMFFKNLDLKDINNFEKLVIIMQFWSCMDFQTSLKEGQIKWFFTQLKKQLASERCDHTLRITKKLLIKITNNEFHYLSTLANITNLGGYCDCEVISNTKSHYYYWKCQYN